MDEYPKEADLQSICSTTSASPKVCATFIARFKQQRKRIENYLVVSRDGLHYDFGPVYAGMRIIPNNDECLFQTVVSWCALVPEYNQIYVYTFH
jgi:hypothetical protein